MILEAEMFSDICKTDDEGLKLFWKDLRDKVSEVFELPLSELENYQQKATQVLNYSI